MDEKMRDIKEWLTEIICEVVHKDEIDENQGLFTMGFDSMKLIYLCGEIEDEFNIDVPLEKVLKLNNIKELSKFIVEEGILRKSDKKNQL